MLANCLLQTAISGQLSTSHVLIEHLEICSIFEMVANGIAWSLSHHLEHFLCYVTQYIATRI